MVSLVSLLSFDSDFCSLRLVSHGMKAVTEAPTPTMTPMMTKAYVKVPVASEKSKCNSK